MREARSKVAGRRSHATGSLTRASLAAGLAAAGACHLVSGVGDLRFEMDPAAGGAAGQAHGGGGAGGHGAGGSATGAGPAGGGGASGGGGSTPEPCEGPSDCPGKDTECATRTCEGQLCGMDYAAAGTACTEGRCDGGGTCSTGASLWAWAAGAAGTENGLAIAVAGTGVVVAGSFTSDFELGGTALTRKGSVDLFVAKLTSAGTVSWVKSFGGSGATVEPAAVAVDASSTVTVAGRFTQSFKVGTKTLTAAGGDDAFVIALDASGKISWGARFGAAGTDRATAIVSAATGPVVAGSFTGSVDFGNDKLTGHGLTDGFVAALDASGAVSWASQLGGDDEDSANAITLLQGGDLAVAGSFVGQLDPAGGAPLVGAGGRDVFVVRLDANGQPDDAAAFGDSGDQVATTVSACPDGDLVVAGWFDGELDFGGGALASEGHDVFLARLGDDLAERYAAGFGNWDTQEPHGLRCDAHDNMVVAGAMLGTIDFGGGLLTGQGGEDVFVAKLAADGTHLWSRRLGAVDNQAALGLATDSGGNLFLTGRLANNMSIDKLPLYSAGGVDLWLAKLQP